MANRLLRNIAVTIGAGLAAGASRRVASRPLLLAAPDPYPILTRLEEVESRVSRVEHAPSAPAGPAPEEIAALGTLLSAQSEDIAMLRQDILRIERRNAEQVESFGQKMASLEQQVPAHIETSISAKMTELEQKLRGEFQEIHHRTIDAFADTIEERIVGRINALENSLIAQSHSIVSLRDKSLRTDDHLQRLLEAVEKLCDRAETQSQITLLEVERPAPPARPAEPPQLPPAQPERHPENVAPESGAEPELFNPPRVDRSTRPSQPPLRTGFKSVGMTILGLAILGFRLIR
jgi:hypothetical protein